MPAMVSNEDAWAVAGDERAKASGPASMYGAVTLLDGQTLSWRPIQPDDVERLRAFHRRLSRDAIIYRFFRYMPELSEADARHFTQIDYDNRMALVATAGEGAEERIVGVARYERNGPDTAEVAFVVEDHWQGHGIATALLHRLAGYARQRGITRFVAVTMGTNLPMLDVFRHAGYPCALRFAATEYTVDLDIREPAPEETGGHR
ncbi:MAG TPA: GNAT family N-acetyltransferase [Ktedonobacterales bacterium]|nr:GNAT family N-acetyltransferase [Ktedonobacterales bacterium]